MHMELQHLFGVGISHLPSILGSVTVKNIMTLLDNY